MPCNLNSSKWGDHTKVRTLADRVESSFGDEDELIEDDASPEPNQVDIDDLEETDLISSPGNFKSKENAIEKEIPQVEEKPKFSQQEIDDAKNRILAAFNMKFTKKVAN